MKRLSAGQISSLLFYRDKDMMGYKVPSSVLEAGSLVHARLGYNQPKLFMRFFLYKGEYWLITGMPDKIDYENGVVEELKTFHSEQVRKRQEKAGKVQLNIYLFLTGLKKGKLCFYDMRKEEMVKIIDVEYDRQFLKRTLNTAIGLQKDIQKFVDKYKKKREGVINGKKQS